MRSIPYGYRMKDGRMICHEQEAEAVRTAFQMYLEGDSLTGISKKTGIGRVHAGMARLLTDVKYLGTEDFPQIIDKELFDRVQEAYRRRREEHKRPTRMRASKPVPTEFEVKDCGIRFEDPFKEAVYLYSQIQERS